MTSDIKLYPSERRQLPYISGYIVFKLYQKLRIRKIECDSKLQALLQALKSSGQDNEFILAQRGGGLVSPSHHLMAMVEELRFVSEKTSVRANLCGEIYPLILGTLCNDDVSPGRRSSMLNDVIDSKCACVFVDGTFTRAVVFSSTTANCRF